MVTADSLNYFSEAIGEIYSVSRFNEGFQNTIYKIKSQKGEYCLRVSKNNSLEHVQYEIDILRCIKDLPTIQLQEIDGKDVFTLDGKAAILYPYIDGEVQEDNSVNELASIGEFLANFHNRCQDVRYSDIHHELYSLSGDVVDRYKLEIEKSDIPHKELLSGIITEFFENKLSENLPHGPIHVDLGPKNTLWKNGSLVAVLDFDNSYDGPYVLDIGKTIMFFASSKGDFNREKAKTIFSAYTGQRNLHEIEKNEIYRAIKYAFLSHIFVDYYMYAKGVTTSEYFRYIIDDLFESYKSFSRQLTEYPDFLEHY